MNNLTRSAGALAFLAALGACGETQTHEDTSVNEAQNQAAPTDPYLWLEEVEGAEALKWAEDMNKKAFDRLREDARFSALEAKALEVYNAADKIAYGTLQAGSVQNYWQDETHVRGVWRRAPLAAYTSGQPNWETVLDVDALAEAEGENWVYKGRNCLAPTFDRCLISLSRGGGDAVVVREFDTETKGFVEGGFETPEAKQWSVWADADTLLIATDFGEGTMNESGYPRQVRRWQRGTPLESAELVLDSDPSLVFNFPLASHRSDGTYTGIIQGPDFFTQIIHLFDGQTLKTLDLPREIDFQGFMGSKMLILMRGAWTVGEKEVAAGSLVAMNVADALAGTPQASLEILASPDENSAIESVTIGESAVFVALLEDVKGRLIKLTPAADGWAQSPVPLPETGSLRVISADSHGPGAFVNFESFTQPDSLYYVADEAPALVQALPARFDANGLITEQKFATSKDGTRVPYFLVRSKDTPMDGSTPTMLYGYGGFEISLDPTYLTGFSQLWVENGGAYVVANIRGGGEYGPRWHQAALKANRQRAYDDFIAVAEDLVSSGLTTPSKLGIRGGSNGGLLMGAMFTQRPDLFEAVICAVPLLDMMRYHTLLAGASWVGEYGNPDIAEERAWIEAYSPYQLINAETEYPEIFFFTSTKDDRVHPGHARKAARKMADQGHPVIYYENTEGGHSAAANLKQRAFTDALQAVYAMQKLMD